MAETPAVLEATKTAGPPEGSPASCLGILPPSTQPPTLNSSSSGCLWVRESCVEVVKSPCGLRWDCLKSPVATGF